MLASDKRMVIAKPVLIRTQYFGSKEQMMHIIFDKSYPYINLSHDVKYGSEITPCNKIDQHLVVYRSMGNVMTP